MPASINYQQVQLYMKAKDLGASQETAAAKAGISARTALGASPVARIDRNADEHETGKPVLTHSMDIGKPLCNRCWHATLDWRRPRYLKRCKHCIPGNMMTN